MVEDFDRGEALDWDGYVEDTGGFLLLDEGFYPFTVTALERERFEGSEKMAPCPRAKLTLEVVAGNRATKVTDRLLLSTKTQWRISQFFESLGFKKEESGKIAMHWNEIVGRSGWIEVGVREYIRKTARLGFPTRSRATCILTTGRRRPSPTPPCSPRLQCLPSLPAISRRYRSRPRCRCPRSPLDASILRPVSLGACDGNG